MLRNQFLPFIIIFQHLVSYSAQELYVWTNLTIMLFFSSILHVILPNLFSMDVIKHLPVLSSFCFCHMFLIRCLIILFIAVLLYFVFVLYSHLLSHFTWWSGTHKNVTYNPIIFPSGYLLYIQCVSRTVLPTYFQVKLLKAFRFCC